MAAERKPASAQKHKAAAQHKAAAVKAAAEGKRGRASQAATTAEPRGKTRSGSAPKTKPRQDKSPRKDGAGRKYGAQKAGGGKTKAAGIAKDHKEQREIRKARRAGSNPKFTLIAQLKTIWEKARVKDMKPEDRRPKTKEMMDMCRGHLMEIIAQHDSARIVQTLIRFGTPEDRQEIFDELKDHILQLSNSKYSRHIVPKMLQHGTKEQRDVIISKFYGHVEKLIRKKIAAEVLASMYLGYCNAAQRTALVEEFYGPHFALFKADRKRSLKDVCEANPEKKPFIIHHVQATLIRMLDKKIASHEILHRVLREFLEVAPEQPRNEVLEALQSLVVEMVHTRDGSRVAMLSFYHGTAKDRKNILKSMKPFVPKIANNEFGHLTIMVILDTVDDTVLLDKMILEPIASNIAEVAETAFGRRVLFYLAAHRNSKYLMPVQLDELRQMDSSPHSKKDMTVRRAELLKASSPFLLKLVVDHAGPLSRDGQSSLLVQAILQNCLGDRTEAFRAILAETESEDEPLIDHGAGHRMLQRLIALPAQEGESATFAKLLLDQLKESEKIAEYASGNRPAFVLTELVRNAEVGQQAKKLVASHLPSFPEQPGAKTLVSAAKGQEVGKGNRYQAPQQQQQKSAENVKRSTPATPSGKKNDDDSPAKKTPTGKAGRREKK